MDNGRLFYDEIDNITKSEYLRLLKKVNKNENAKIIGIKFLEYVVDLDDDCPGILKDFIQILISLKNGNEILTMSIEELENPEE